MDQDVGTIRRLRVTGTIAVLTITLMTVITAGYLAWRYSVAPSTNDTINRSGLRRGQSVAVLYRAERLSRFPGEVSQLDAAMAKLARSQSGLPDLTGGDRAFFERFMTTARAVAARPRDVARRDELDALGPHMYQIFYDKTIAYANTAALQRSRSFVTEMSVSAITLLALILLSATVIRPGVRFVERSLRHLEERRQRFAAMFDNSSEMMAVYAPDGRITRANTAALQRLGFTQEAIGKHYDIHVAPQDRAVVAQAFALAAAGEPTEIGNINFLDSAGRQIPVLVSVSPIVVRQRFVGVVGTARDMTSERQIERELLRSRERFRSLFEASASAVIALKPDGIISEVNVAFERLSGYRNEDLVGRPITTIVPAEFHQRIVDRIQAVLAGDARTYRGEMLARDGTGLTLDTQMLPIRIDGRSEGVFLIGNDITHEDALARLDQSDERMRALYRVASAPDEGGASQIGDALALGAKALGMEYGFVSEIEDGIATIRYRLTPDEVLPPGTRFESLSIGRKIFDSPRAVSFEDLAQSNLADELAERQLAWKSCIGSRVLVEGVPYGLLVFFSDTVRAVAFERADRDFIDLMSVLVGSALGRLRLQNALTEMAFHDPLTGLANRALLEEHLERAIAQSARTGDLVAVHYLDLDDFKPVNDDHGHVAGDAVLCEVARRLAATVRAHDVIARIGGDEFVVLQVGTAQVEHVHQLAGRLRESIIEPFELGDGLTARVGVSIGTAIYPLDTGDAGLLMRAADIAMYAQKAERIKPTDP